MNIALIPIPKIVWPTLVPRGLSRQGFILILFIYIHCVFMSVLILFISFKWLILYRTRKASKPLIKDFKVNRRGRCVGQCDVLKRSWVTVTGGSKPPGRSLIDLVTSGLSTGILLRGSFRASGFDRVGDCDANFLY